MFLPESASRRQFLQTLSRLFALGLYSPFAVSALSASGIQPALAADESGAVKNSYKLADWTGDNFTFGHELREGNLPKFPLSSDYHCDFVIVGGGISGLTSAYYLKDHDFLLLEQYDQLGGQSIGRSYRGIDYSLGAAYVSTNDGLVGKLFDELSIKPVAMPPLRNSWYYQGQWLPGFSGSNQHTLYKEFDRFKKEAQPIWQKLNTNEGQLPQLDSDLASLDAQTFASYLKSYDAKFVSLLDSFCLSALCGTTAQVSALAGMDLAQDIFDEAYVFKGGNPAIAVALKDKIAKTGAGRMQNNTFVWTIDLKDNGATVVYSDKQGQLHRVACRHVIVTAPPLVASRIIPLMDDSLRAKLFTLKFGSYLVANFCLKNRIFNGSYDNNVDDPFTFADFVLAETPYIATGSYKPEMGSVVTCYQPYSPISPGRPMLLAGNREEFASQLIGQFSKLIDGFEKNLDEVVLTRWGHAMVVYRPNTYKTVSEIYASKSNSFTLAHNSMQGIPCAESAIAAARHAANVALGQ